MGFYRTRAELVKHLVTQGHEVSVSCPKDEYAEQFVALGCDYIPTSVDRRGTNFFVDLLLILHYMQLCRQIKPEVVLTFSVKPNVYGGLVCRALAIPHIANVTGLGTAVEEGGWLSRAVLFLYRVSISRASCVMFQNNANKRQLISIVSSAKARLIPGSGVNLLYHCCLPYPEGMQHLNFLFVGRVMRAKGITEFLEAAGRIKQHHPNFSFNVVGFCEENFGARLAVAEAANTVKYHGQQDDIRPFLARAHVIVMPSYHEGLCNVLLEAAASCRPIIASNVPGCKETFDEGISGFGFRARDVDDLTDALIRFIELPHETKAIMGRAGREKMEREFDRSRVINAYMEEIDKSQIK